MNESIKPFIVELLWVHGVSSFGFPAWQYSLLLLFIAVSIFSMPPLLLLSAPPRGCALHFGNHWTMLNTPLQACQFEILLHFNTNLYFRRGRLQHHDTFKGLQLPPWEWSSLRILILKSANHLDFLSSTLMHGVALFFFSQNIVLQVFSLLCVFSLVSSVLWISQSSAGFQLPLLAV